MTTGLTIAAFLLGLRHGIDWDHIIAISDIAATTETRQRGAWLGALYVFGHASVVIALGLGAIALGATVPDWLDATMGKLVGVTLIVLGLVVVYTLIVERGEFRARSRWLILFSGLRRASSAARRALGASKVSTFHIHGHAAVAEVHHGGASDAPDDPGDRVRAPRHTHPHAHPDWELDEYSSKASVAIGMLHGVGAETPTQVVVFLAAANAGGFGAGLGVLFVFVLGLAISNLAITGASAFGFGAATRGAKAQIALGGMTAAMSLFIGTLFLLGMDAFLPSFFAG